MGQSQKYCYVVGQNLIGLFFMHPISKFLILMCNDVYINKQYIYYIYKYLKQIKNVRCFYGNAK